MKLKTFWKGWLKAKKKEMPSPNKVKAKSEFKALNKKKKEYEILLDKFRNGK
jgi:hypothetical protein